MIYRKCKAINFVHVYSGGTDRIFQMMSHVCSDSVKDTRELIKFTFVCGTQSLFHNNRGRKCPVSWWTKLLFNDGMRHINIHNKTIVIHGRVVSGRNGVHQQSRTECDLQYFLSDHVNIGKCAQRRSMTSIRTFAQKYYLPLEKLQLVARVSHTCMTDWMNLKSLLEFCLECHNLK